MADDPSSLHPLPALETLLQYLEGLRRAGQQRVWMTPDARSALREIVRMKPGRMTFPAAPTGPAPQPEAPPRPSLPTSPVPPPPPQTLSAPPPTAAAPAQAEVATVPRPASSREEALAAVRALAASSEAPSALGTHQINHVAELLGIPLVHPRKDLVRFKTNPRPLRPRAGIPLHRNTLGINAPEFSAAILHRKHRVQPKPPQQFSIPSTRIHHPKLSTHRLQPPSQPRQHSHETAVHARALRQIDNHTTPFHRPLPYISLQQGTIRMRPLPNHPQPVTTTSTARQNSRTYSHNLHFLLISTPRKSIPRPWKSPEFSLEATADPANPFTGPGGAFQNISPRIPGTARHLQRPRS